jgi:2,5-diamino-6-(ribosylamino)-4(3H)-pyrimidinone 5'-phosphate reductase
MLARHLPPLQGGNTYPLPQPVILDTNLRFSLSCKLLKNYAAGAGRQPLIVCSSIAEDSSKASRRRALEDAGAKVLVINDAPMNGGIFILTCMLA